MNLHNEIMNIPCDVPDDHAMVYRLGHRDARHAAAELALKADARIDELTAERDAAFAMSRCECGTDEACKNLATMATRISELEKALRRAAQVIAWNCHGDCRAFGEGPIPPSGLVTDEIRAAMEAKQ